MRKLLNFLHRKRVAREDTDVDYVQRRVEAQLLQDEIDYELEDYCELDNPHEFD